MRTTLTGLTSRRPFTLLGILLAFLVIAAFVLVALNAGTGTSVPQRNVVVATRDLAPRIPLDATALSVKSIPVARDYPQVFFTSVQDVIGMVPLVAIATGMAVTANDVTRPNQALGAQSEYLPIATGYVALTIPTSEQQGVADYIQPDDYISVIATVSSGGKVASLTIYTNVHVIKVGLQGATAGSTATATSLTVVVTECQAEFITWFLTYASLKYTLESYHDYLKPATQVPDPTCQTVSDAHGVTQQIVQTKYPKLFSTA